MTDLSTEFRNFFFWYNASPGAEKITFPTGTKGEHFTIRFWSRRRCFDFHITNELTGIQEQYFEMKYYTFIRFLIDLAKVQQNLILKLWMPSTINLGKLKHHNCILFAQSTDKAELSDILKIKGSSFRFSKNIDFEKLESFYLEPKSLLKSDKEIFQVYKLKNGHLKRQGFLYKLNDRRNKKQFIFVTNKIFRIFRKEILNESLNLLEQRTFENKDRTLKFLHEKFNLKFENQIK